ncbi:chromosome replication initiator DnaA [Alcanivorax hongdengensis A-11-3]|uniref:Chromosome replication initiator DnaA n=1 Tax=Alcanivorax hongdengensis A-11-3 TaxID=1177179 RepID=L0W859_9GAMM|nr:chromosome replication initiator DnaA [Alcanivorax hongdengensis A-11-3]
MNNNLNSKLTFDNFVEGKSNRMALAATRGISEHPALPTHKPLLLYGSTGVGKTHLIHAAGNALIRRNPNAKVIYLHTERFMANRISALHNNTINEFKRFYYSANALLVDEIQFFAGKEEPQEDLHHIINALLENGQPVILTCDRSPQEADSLEKRLKSLLSCGRSLPMKAPDLETRMEILKRKAEEAKIGLPNDTALFIAQRIGSNVRELEGALRQLVAHVRLTGEQINIRPIQETLKDFIALQARPVYCKNLRN